MGHYLFHLALPDARNGWGLRETAAAFMEAGLWAVRADEAHADALAPGDQVLVYLGPPERVFVGRARLASGVRPWTPAEARTWSVTAAQGVALDAVETWDPPIPMAAVLARIPASEKAKGDFEVGVVGITPPEYDAALAAAAASTRS